MKKYIQILAPLVAIVVVIFVVGTVYLFKKTPNTEIIKENKENRSIQENNSIEIKRYFNEKYNFQFDYPASWIVEEKNLPDFFEGATGKDFYTGLAVVITNPDFSKKKYDCCYTPEEIEKYGEKPVLVLMVIDSIKHSYSMTMETFGIKTKNILTELVDKGYTPKTTEQILSFVPTVGKIVYEDGKPTEKTTWNDDCSDIGLVYLNNNDVVKFSGCPEGVFKNTGALFIRKDNLIFQLLDQASEYSNIGKFDMILESFKFN